MSKGRNAAKVNADLRRAVAVQRDLTGKAQRHAADVEREVSRLQARIAELEAEARPGVTAERRRAELFQAQIREARQEVVDEYEADIDGIRASLKHLVEHATRSDIAFFDMKFEFLRVLRKWYGVDGMRWFEGSRDGSREWAAKATAPRLEGARARKQQDEPGKVAETKRRLARMGKHDEQPDAG